MPVQGITAAELQAIMLAGTDIVVAGGIGAARAIGIMLILPVFTRPQIGGLLRGGIAIALSMPILQYSGASLAEIEGPSRSLHLILLSMKEIFIGVMLGFLMSMPLWAVQAVGEIMDTQRGITSEVAPLDPSTHSQSSTMGLFLAICAITVFVVAGGLQSMIEMLYGSYRIWPITSFLPQVNVTGMMAMIGLLDGIMRTALIVAGPVLIFLLLIDVSVMLLGRFAPQFKPNDLAPMIKNVGFAIFIVVYAVYLMDFIKLELAQTHNVLEQFRDLMK